MVKRFLLILLCLGMMGCSLNKHFVVGVDAYASAILPEYEAYIILDVTLSDESKRIRIQTSESFKKLRMPAT